ncbi:hypothetical protein GII30_07965 [Gordonia amarae]|nr:hypothetical protein [Gordonia amarae]MCS3878316.1 hypothetical protein [Gordonia amarae]QHN16963.1 hypothetical protein GII35_08190 [Gordonia amarae]QHN21489.1 hypothetical protein GII34_07970 [Gordonia amarae]QHN30339.1 hypothetical protein GII32_07980 [Gordonia amarae]QHN39116.1 hypothetical protein GII30_07965 [Gordonia amarae]
MNRIDHLGERVSMLLDRIADADVAACTNLLIITVIDGTGVDDLAEVRDMLGQWRTHGALPTGLRIELDAARIRAEFTAHTCRQNNDPDGQHTAFARARALDCLLRATMPGLSREAFTDVVYEAAAAIGKDAVIAALAEYAPG